MRRWISGLFARRRWRRLGSAIAATTCALAVVGCAPTVSDEQLRVSGGLERDGIYGTETNRVDMDFLSNDARGQWWPCDMRMTAGACIGDHHVNVYITAFGAQDIGDLGRGDCIVDGRPRGVYQRMDLEKAGIYSIGNDFSVFVVVASDIVEPAGADFLNDEETTAVTRLASGEVEVVRFRGLDNAEIDIRGTTVEGNEITIQFRGPMSIPASVPPLEDEGTCVDAALVE